MGSGTDNLGEEVARKEGKSLDYMEMHRTLGNVKVTRAWSCGGRRQAGGPGAVETTPCGSRSLN